MSNGWKSGPVVILGGPNITATMYCICLSELETCAYADAVQYNNEIKHSSINFSAN